MTSFSLSNNYDWKQCSGGRVSAWGLGVLFCFLVFSPSLARGAWERQIDPPAVETPIDLTLCKQENCFYLATPHQVFQRFKEHWFSVFTLSAGTDLIQKIHVSPSNPFIWIRTQQKIYRMDPKNGAWLQIYETNNPDKFPTAFFAGKDTLWLGTISGLWLSRDSGKTWQKRSDWSDHLPVHCIAETSHGLFFSADGEWRNVASERMQTLFHLFEFKDSSETETTTSSETTLDENLHAVNSFFDFLEAGGNFYVSTTKGVFQSLDGNNWKLLSNSGLRNPSFTHLLWEAHDNSLIGLGLQGIFRFDEKSQKWISQNDGLAQLEIHAALLLPTTNALIAANSEGLWTWQEPKENLQTQMDPKKIDLLKKLIKEEPSMREIHNRVVRYANVSNGKIKRWHAQSRIASILPNLSLGKDLYRANNIDLDRGGTSDKDFFIEGPADKHRSMSLDLSWDLGNFIFSSSQTSIDSREKLMVDLRNDLLSEATRIYFERRRLQTETIYAPSPDEKTHLDKILRLEELTASIDALTGGYFSEKLEKIYRQNQKFYQLWEFK